MNIDAMQIRSSNILKRSYTMTKRDSRDASLVQYSQIDKCDTSHKLKDRNHMILSVDAENAFKKIQHLFLI